jgi:hypothetical protein
VIYIAGYGRSGSTVLDRAIGRHDGFVSLGEAWKFWSHAAYADQYCGCGRRFSQCELWLRVREIDPSLFDRAQAERFYHLHEREFRTVRMLRLLSRHGRENISDAFPAEYTDAVGRLYRAVQEASGAQVLVDSSKNPVYGYLLAGVEGIDVAMVHLVRDPRAVAYSWTRLRRDPGATEERMMYRHSPAKSAVFWDVWNVSTAAVARARGVPCVLVRYPDVVERLAAVVETVTNLAGHPVPRPEYADVVEFDVDHTVSGNPARFEQGAIPLRLDDEWRSALRAPPLLTVTALCAPLLRHYGFPLRARASEGGAHLERGAVVGAPPEE